MEKKRNTLLSRLTQNSARLSGDISMLEGVLDAIDGSSDPRIRHALDRRPTQRRNPAALAIRGLHAWLRQARAALGRTAGGRDV